MPILAPCLNAVPPPVPEVLRALVLRATHASPYLSCRFATAVSATKLTLSLFLRRDSATDCYVLGTGAAHGAFSVSIAANGQLILALGASSLGMPYSYTSATAQNFSTWRHLLISVDTTRATGRVAVYLDGVAITMSPMVLSEIPQNFRVPLPQTFYIGSSVTTQKFVGRIALPHLILGHALSPSAFRNPAGEPVEYNGDYGTHGFRLKFAPTGVAPTVADFCKDSGPNNILFTSPIGILTGDFLPFP